MEVTDLAGENCIRLPMYPMNQEEINYTTDVINQALKLSSGFVSKKAA